MKQNKATIYCSFIFSILFSSELIGNNILPNTEDSLHITAKMNSVETDNFPELQRYIQAIEAAQKLPIPIQKQTFSASDNRTIAQVLCINDSSFTIYTRDPSGAACRNEVFGVYPARTEDIMNNSVQINNNYFRVVMYNFTLRVTTIAIVEIDAKKVIQVTHYKDMQPELPSTLKELAINIAIKNAYVQEALGYTPEVSESLMADTKTALNRSTCEKSKHLCVAPTFVKGNKALWAIVDLNTLNVSGTRWTNLDDNNITPNMIISERKIQNEYITNCFCNKTNTVEKNGWKANYHITNSDGLEISNITFNNTPVCSSVKLVDWHVSYSRTDGFGYSDAVGCPYFTSATVVAIEAPKIESYFENEQCNGFSLTQYFRSDDWPNPCNYEYYQKIVFLNDGSMKVIAASIGKGCGNDGTYMPVFRIELPAINANLSFWNGKQYEKIKQESWFQNPSQLSLNSANPNFTWNSKKSNINIYASLEKKSSALVDNDSYIYFTLNNLSKNEGKTDLPTIGPCCNTDYQQGPEKFIDAIPEDISNKPIVMWFVPKMKNSNQKGKEKCWVNRVIKDGQFIDYIFPCESGLTIQLK
jgi:hypothetical protein